MPIFQKMFVICILVTVTISVISGGITYVAASDIILKKTIAQTEETINQVSENYDSFMEMIANRLDYIAFNPTVQEELLNRRPEKNEEGYYGSTRTVKRLLVQMFKSYQMEDIEIYGFLDGYKGLIYGDFRMLTGHDFAGILTKGGTILGSSRTPFKLMREPDENGLDKVEAMKQNYYKLKLDCIVILGGNGTHKTANMLREEGLNVITLPKTIDNDLWGTDMTFGFQSAVNIATDCIDCIHTTASSHARIFIVEVMGHKVGWLTLNAGMAGGADIILIPEIPYDINKVIKAINEREARGSRFTIMAVAEGAISKEDAKLSKKEYKKKMENNPYPSVSYEVADKIRKKSGKDVRVTVPGHTQRGGSPCPYDRVFATRLGAEAGKLILKGEYGFMVGYKNREVVKVSLEDVAGKLKMVSPDATIVKEAKMVGISFGD